LEKLFAEKSNKIQKLMSNGLSSTCYIGDFITYTSWQGDIPIGKPELEILYPTPTTTEWITAEPKMPTVTCKARLKNYNKGTVKFRWEYWVSNEFKRRNRKDQFNPYYSLCPRIGKSVFLGYSYSENSETTLWEVPFLRDSGNYYFKAIWYKNKPDLHPAYGCENSYTEYEGDNEAFTGGKVWVKVTAYDAAGKEIVWDTTSADKLLGVNEQDLNKVYAYAGSKEIIAILQHESRTKQFETDASMYPMYEKDWPVYGYPNGYGLMQIDNPAAVEEQLWNWKSNIKGGEKIFNGKKKDASDVFLKWKWPLDENGQKYLMINSFHRYNANISYYIYIPLSKEWIADPLLKDEQKQNHYGDNVYKKYKKLNP